MKVFSSFILFLLAISLTYAQSLNTNQLNTISAGGADLKDIQSGYSLSWVLGEFVIETFKNDVEDMQVTQGFLQISSLLTTSDRHFLPFDVKVFPNPTADRINIEVDYSGYLSFELITILGEKILRNDIFYKVPQSM